MYENNTPCERVDVISSFKEQTKNNKSVFSFVRQQLTTWHSPHLLTAGPPTVQQSIDISCPPGPQHNPQQRRAAAE